MKQPLVSVLLPCHGEAPFLPETIESVLNQSFSDFELIIILDRASKATSNLVDKSIQLDSRVQVLISNNPGISEALNLGIRSSKGKYLARIDADDKMINVRLQEQLDAFYEDPNLVCVGSQLSVITENGNFIRVTNYPESNPRIKKSLKIRNVIAHPSVMMLSSAVIEVGGYRPIFDGAEDYDLWLRLASKGTLRNLKQPLTFYRTHSGQMTEKNRGNQLHIDSQVRDQNYSRKIGRYGLRRWSALTSARLLNEFLGKRVPSRFPKLIIAFFVNPAQTVTLIFYILIPEVKGRLQPCKK